MSADFARTKRCVDHYRSLGLCPLPSRMDIKGPMLRTYAEHYGPTPVPESVYSEWATMNVQILTGIKTPTRTKIIVVDLDGREALDVWRKITAANHYIPNKGWMSITGSGGHHHWFLLPDGMTECPSGLIWGIWDTWGDEGRGKWAKHKEIRILADNALVVAPPSIHVDTGKRYEFLLPNPNSYRLPEVAPDWLLAMPRLSSPRFGEPPKLREPRTPYVRQSDRYYTREEVIDAVGEAKFDIACREWGLVPACSGPNPNGWCPCFMPGREDPRYSRPSGSFHFRDGTLQDRKDLSSISFFDLAVLLGAFNTWQDARDALGDRFIGKRCKEPTYRYSY